LTQQETAGKEVFNKGQRKGEQGEGTQPEKTEQKANDACYCLQTRESTEVAVLDLSHKSKIHLPFSP
jgi:hypothetical protein